MSSRKQAFTLIELLVVIAIIAILAAILFPVFAQAKAAAKHTTNLSSVKNLGLAGIMYAGDADDQFSTNFNHDSLNDFGEPQGEWQPYIKNREIVYDVNRTRTGCDTYIDPKGRCVGFAPNFGVWDYNGGTGMFQTSSDNFPITTSYGGTQNGRMWVGRSMTSFDAPAEMVMIMTTADTPMFTTAYYFQDGDGKIKEPRSGGKWVRCFVDGHAKTVFYGAYTIQGTYIQMPKALTDANMLCRAADAVETMPTGATSPFTGMKCADINAYIVANRVKY
jgi:prepilin-type N-terminal cleavage/methylation domain-containing protein